MERTLIIDCNNKIDETVLIEGWVLTRRDHGKIAFLDVRDRTGVIQVFCRGEQIEGIGSQNVVAIKGEITPRPEKLVNPNIETGGIELQAEEVVITAKAAELPFDMGGKELDLQLPTLLDFRSLTLRHPSIQKIFKVQESIVKGFRKVAEGLDCTEIFVPTIAASASEGGAEVFKVGYYAYKATLTQSPQLYKQMLVPVFERVYTIAHAYRAEPSVTTRHLAESTQMDCEFGFVNFDQLLDLLEEVAVKMLQYAQDECEKIFEELGVPKIAFGKPPRLTLREAQEVIFKETGRDNRQEKDLTPQDEVDICKWALKEHGSDFVIITHFPTSKRAFYTMPDPKEPEYSLSYDLLFRGLEMSSGSLRVNDYDQIVGIIKNRGMDPVDFELYLQAFKFGMPPEGGFSFGLERLTMNVLQLKNVREASLYPRDMERVDIRLSTIQKKK